MAESEQTENSEDIKSDITRQISTGKCRFLKLLAKQIQRLNCSGCSRTRAEDLAEVNDDAKADRQLTETSLSVPKGRKSKKILFGWRKSKQAKRDQKKEVDEETDKNKAEGRSTPPPTAEERIYRPRRRHPFYQQPYEGGFYSYFGEQELEEMIPKYNPPSLKKLASEAHFDFLKNGPKRRRRRHWFHQSFSVVRDWDDFMF